MLTVFLFIGVPEGFPNDLVMPLVLVVFTTRTLSVFKIVNFVQTEKWTINHTVDCSYVGLFAVGGFVYLRGHSVVDQVYFTVLYQKQISVDRFIRKG